MTHDEIIGMAIMKCGFVSHEKPTVEASEIFVCNPKDIIDFAKLVVQHEREACAKIAEDMGLCGFTGESSASAIRARGQT